MSQPLPEETAAKFELMDSKKMSDGSFKYFTGAYSEYKEASIMENSLRFWGFENAKVIARFNQNIISIADARTLQNNLNYVDEAVVMNEMSTQNIKAESFKFNSQRGVYYQIEIGPMSQHLLEETAARFELMDSKKMPDGFFKYFAGAYSEYEEASIMENSLKFWGVEEAEVVAFFNKEKISIADAQTLQNNQNHYDEAYVLGYGKPEFDALAVEEFEGFEFHYSVQVEMNSHSQADNLLETTYNMRLKVNEGGEHVYSIGKLSRIEEAREIRARLLNDGINNAFIVAYFNGRRISTLAAADLQRSYEENMAEAVSK